MACEFAGSKFTTGRTGPLHSHSHVTCRIPFAHSLSSSTDHLPVTLPKILPTLLSTHLLTIKPPTTEVHTPSAMAPTQPDSGNPREQSDAATPKPSTSTLVKRFLEASHANHESRATPPPQRVVQPRYVERFDTTPLYPTSELRHDQHQLPVLGSGQGRSTDKRLDNVLNAEYGEMVLVNQAEIHGIQPQRPQIDPQPAANEVPLQSIEGEDADASMDASDNDEIPEEIKRLCRQIKAVKKNARGLPMRVPLREALPDHFESKSRLLSTKSPVYEYYGDTRLFSEEEWRYLTEAKKRGGNAEEGE